MANTLLDKYYSRLKKEGIVRSLLFGLAVGFAVDFVIAFAGWFPGKAIWLWLALGIGAASGVAAAVLSYFLLFKPTEKSMAKRLDSLGLEERVITMTQFKSDESFVAAKQRQNAEDTLAGIEPSAVKISLPKALIIAAAVVCVFGVAMTTVNALTVFDVIPRPVEIITGRELEEENYVFITYSADEGGHLFDVEDGDATELDISVVYGGDAPTVIAVPEDGWMFDGWSDGVTSPQRTDTGLIEDKLIIAFFMQVEDEEGTGIPGMGGTPRPSNRPGDANGNRPNEGNHAGGGRYTPSNNVYDNNTPYADVFDDYYDEAIRELTENDSLTPAQREMLESYFESLHSGVVRDGSEDEEEDSGE